MPEFAQIEQPQQRQAPVLAFDPKQTRIEALTEVNTLLEKCKAELRENQNQNGIISSFSKIIKSENKEQTLGIYSAIINESNHLLRNENAPFHLSGELKGESFYVVAGYYDKKLPQDGETEDASIHLSDETAQKILYLVKEDMRNHESKEKYQPRIQRLGSAIIRVVQGSVDKQNDVAKIITPEELATAMLDYKEGRTTAMPIANCIGISLLTNELLQLSGFDTSIVNVHGISKDGEQTDGHATAAVVADGWLIDPALLTSPKKISGMTLDRNNKGYASFSKEMEGIYLAELGKGKEDLDKPATLEYTEDKSESELKALYLLENGIRLFRQGKEEDGKKQVLEASSLNPKNFYAAYRSFLIIREEKQNEALKLIKQCADLTPGIYLANDYAAGVLSNTARTSDSTQLMEEAYNYSKKAVDLQPDAVLPALRHVIIAAYLKKNEESEPLAQKFYNSLPENSPYKELFEPYLAKK